MTTIETHEYYMTICDARAQTCKCHSRQIAALIVTGEVIIPGYNGPPRGVPHCEHRPIPRGEKETTHFHPCLRRRLEGYESGKMMEYCIATHAEVNAILNAARNGVRTMGATLYLNETTPCPKCMTAIINAGIQDVVYDATRSPYDQIELSEWLALHGGVRLVPFHRPKALAYYDSKGITDEMARDISGRAVRFVPVGRSGIRSTGDFREIVKDNIIKGMEEM